MVRIVIEQMQLSYIFSIKKFPYCVPIRVDTRLVPRLAMKWCKKLDMVRLFGWDSETDTSLVPSL